MADYGWMVRQANGKIIMDDQFPNLMATTKGTLSLDLHSSDSTAKYTCNATSTNGDTVYFDEFRTKVPRNTDGELIFFEVTEGTRVYVGYWSDETLMVYSNRASLRWVRAKFMRYLPAPPAGSWGLAVQDAQGRYTYSSSENFLICTGTLVSPPATGMWVAPSPNGLIGGPNEGFSGLYFDQGVRRSGGVLIPEALRGNISRDLSATAARTVRVRGLVADVDWTQV